MTRSPAAEQFPGTVGTRGRRRRRQGFEFTRTNVAHGTTLYTDGEASYRGIARRLQLRHEPVNLVASRRHASEALPAVHQVASLLKRWLAGTLHDGQSAEHLAYYLDEYTFRFNRRRSRSRGLLWFRLVQQAVNTDPHPLAVLTTTSSGHGS
ncbi:MAG: transposase [Acidimicrobiia bacterium]|nr:transposase [Acidimicrobiia bacterium]